MAAAATAPSASSAGGPTKKGGLQSTPSGTISRQKRHRLNALDKEKERLQELVKIRVSREDVIGKTFLPHRTLRWIIGLIQHKYWPAVVAFACLLWTLADYEEILALQIIAMMYVGFIFGCYFFTINVWCVLLSLGAFEPIYLLYNTFVCCIGLCYTATFAVEGRAFCCVGFVFTNILLSMIDATQMQKRSRLIMTTWLLGYWSAMLGCSYSLFRFREAESQYVLPLVGISHTVNWHTLFQNSVMTLIIFIAKDTFNEVRLKNGETKYLTKVVSFSWYDPGDDPAYEDFDVSPEGEGTKAEALQEQALCILRGSAPRRRLPQEGFICGVTRAGMEREPAEVLYKELAAESNSEAGIQFMYTWAEHRGVRLKEKLILDLEQLGAQNYFDVSVVSASGMEMVSSVQGPQLRWHRHLIEDDFPVDVHAHVEAGVDKSDFLSCWPPLAARRPALLKFNRAMQQDHEAVWAALLLLSDQASAVVLIQSQFRFSRSRLILNRARVSWRRVAHDVSTTRAMSTGRPTLTLRQTTRAWDQARCSVRPPSPEDAKHEDSHHSADTCAVSEPSKCTDATDFMSMAPNPATVLPGQPPSDNVVLIAVASKEPAGDV